jgi:Secretion system C-terminal sorting domain
MKITVSIFILLLIGFLPVSAQTTSEILDIGSGGISSISKDGNYVCGSNYPNPPFLWSQANGRTNVGNVEGEAYSVSNNGIVVGRFLDSNLTFGGAPVLRAGYFAGNQWWGLQGIPGVPPLDDHDFTHAYGINSEGNKVVGMVWHTDWHVEACYWSIPDTGIGLLGQTGGSNSRANVISNDGSIIAGWDGTTNGPDRRAFYWDPAPHFMGGFDTTYLVGECDGMNSDGSVIVGGSVWPFIWTQATGMQQVVADSSVYWSGQALGVSDNGIIVGYVDPGSFNYQAFIKKPGWSDIVYLSTYINDSLGIPGYSNWYFAFGQAISADGKTIGISAYPPGSGISEALLLKIDQSVPVELSSFTASVSNSVVNLNWSTATETNNSGFAVERKTQSSTWQQIGFVKGNGTTTQKSSYSFKDDITTSAKYYYRLKQVDFDGSINYSNIAEVDVNTISEFSLNQNYPNPFNPSTSISFTIPEQSQVKLTIYNMLGEKVVELVNEVKNAGKYDIKFTGNNLSSGTYIYRLEAGSFISTRKMILLK